MKVRGLVLSCGELNCIELNRIGSKVGWLNGWQMQRLVVPQLGGELSQRIVNRYQPSVLRVADGSFAIR